MYIKNIWHYHLNMFFFFSLFCPLFLSVYFIFYFTFGWQYLSFVLHWAKMGVLQGGLEIICIVFDVVVNLTSWSRPKNEEGLWLKACISLRDNIENILYSVECAEVEPFNPFLLRLVEATSILGEE